MNSLNTLVPTAMSRAEAVLLEHLRILDEASHSEGRTALTGRLKALATDLAEHFRLEEQGGYMDVVRKRQPRLEHEVQHLEHEHRALGNRLNELIGEAGGANGSNAPFQEKVRSWIEQMRLHECRENLLVEEAFNLDIAAED